MAIRNFTNGGIDNYWTTAGNWDTPPVASDTANITAGSHCEYDTDNSAGAGNTLTIQTGAIFKPRADAGGPYVFKCSGNITGVGTGYFNIGTSVAVPYPFARKFTLDMNGKKMVTTNLCVTEFCTNPANRVIKLLNNEAVGATVLEVDTDVTADIWAAGDTILVANNAAGKDAELLVIAAGGIAAGAITVNGPGLVAAKQTGAYMFLVTRHVRHIGALGAATTGGALTHRFDGEYRYAYATSFSALNLTFDGILSRDDGTCSGLFLNCQGTMSGVVAFGSGSGNGLISGDTTGKLIVSGYVAAGVNGLYECDGVEVSGTIVGCTQGSKYGWGTTYKSTALIDGCATGILRSSGLYLDGADIVNCTTGMSECARVQGSATLTNNTVDIFRGEGELYNTAFGGLTEHDGYSLMPEWQVLESQDHDAGAGAFRSWSRGGVINGVTGAGQVPTGFARGYNHVFESATRMNIRQQVVRICPAAKLIVSAWLRKDAAMAYLPRVQIVDPYADPLVDAAHVALAEGIMTNSVNTWENLTINYTNTTDRNLDVIIRVQGENAANNLYENFNFSYIGGGMAMGGMFLNV